MANLKFFRGALGAEQLAQVVVGAIWFDVDTKTIKVCTKVEGESITWEPYAGMLTDANWDSAKAQLTITKADGSSEVLDFSHVASKEEVTTLSQTVSANAIAAADGIDEAKAAAADALAAAGTAEQNAKDYTDEKLGVYASEGVEATGLRKEIAEKVAAVDTKVGTVSDKVDALESAVTAEGGLVDKVEVLESYFSGSTEGGVAGIVDAKINALDADITSAEGTKVRVQVVETNGKITGVNVTEDFSTITNAIAAEAQTARAAEGANAANIAAEKARIDALIGSDSPAEGETQVSIRDIVIDEVATQLTSDNISDSFDTLKEMAEWLSDHPADVQEMNDAIGANTTAIATLNGTGEGSVAKAVADAKAEVIAEIEANEETTAAALTELDERVDALEALNVDTELSGLKDRVLATETAVNTTLPNDIETAKGQAVAAAKTETETQIAAEVERAEAAYEKKDVAAGLVNALANGAVKDNTDKIAANEQAIKTLQDDLAAGLSWAYFA